MLREYDDDWIVVGLHCGALEQTVVGLHSSAPQKPINIATPITVIVDDIQEKQYRGESEYIYRSKTWNHGYMDICIYGQSHHCDHNDSMRS